MTGDEMKLEITVALSIDDAELEGRVRPMIAGDPGLHIAARDDPRPDLRITDGVAVLDGGAPVLVFSSGGDALGMLRAGAAAVLSENAGADALGAAIRAVAHGLTVVGEDARGQLVPRSGSDGLAEADDEFSPIELTERELQVLAVLAEGASNKVIARSLGITPHTVKFHVASIIAKLDATGRTEAVAKAMRMGLLLI